jgi:hypothetical protein
MTANEIDREVRRISDLLSISGVQWFVADISSDYVGSFVTGISDPYEKTVIIPVSALKSVPQTIYSLAHGIRHVWQYQERKPWFKNQMKEYAGEAPSVNEEAYQTQPTELDATAFALYWTRKRTGSIVTLKGISFKSQDDIVRESKRMAGWYGD